MDGCLDDNALAGYFDGALTPDEIARVDAHIDGCAACRNDLSAMAVAHSVTALATGSSDTLENGFELELVPGDKIGRYILISERARGGMGVVAVAYDPELGRNVAIKVLRPEISARLAGVGQDHLREEARAMASLSHPNVVSVHDVGEHAGRIFLAMELVDGVSLRAWLAVERRGWRASLRTCIRAGRGLAAAHRAGLVHRDFKPDNVLCGPDDRVRVTDFGLARRDGVTARSGAATGIVGTPSYMAPEIWCGEAATPRSDQWSFCATVYEALFGAPPFRSSQVRELGAAIRKGGLEPPRRPGVPARVARAIARGLRVSPGERFASIDELLGVLDSAVRRPRAAWIAAGAIAVLALGGTAVYAARRADPAERCVVPASLLDGAWDASRHQAIDAAFAAGGRKHGPESARRVAAVFDGYAKQWLAARTDACVATRIRGDQSEAMLDARGRCLDRRRSELAELTRLLGDHPTPRVIDRSIQAALGLTPIDGCSAVGVAAEPPVRADRAAQVAAVERELAEITAAFLVARFDATEARLRALLERARSIGYPPLLARVTVTLARLASVSTDPAEAERTLFDALHAAATAHDDRLVALVWTQIVSHAANQQGDPALALTYTRAAEAALARADSPPDLRGDFDQSRGIALQMQGKLEDARASFEAALAQARRRTATLGDRVEVANTEIALCNVELQLAHIEQASRLCKSAVEEMEAELGPSHPLVGFALIGYGNVLTDLSDDAAARATLERARVILEDTVGERHESYGIVLSNLGRLAERAGEVDAARKLDEQALAILEALHHPEVFAPEAQLGNLDWRIGRLAEAREHWERARSIAVANEGDDGDRVALSWISLAGIAFSSGDLTRAEAGYRRALAIVSKKYGDDHPRSADALAGLGLVFSTRDDCKHGVELQRRALASLEKLYGPDDASVAPALTSLGECQRQLRDRTALATLERALAIHAKFPATPPFEPAATRWVLAQALWDLGGDRARATALAKEARALYAKATEPEAAAVLPHIDRWIAARAR